MEGSFSRALLLRKEDGSEIIAKIPFPIAGPRKYTTASEVAVLRYCKFKQRSGFSVLNLRLVLVHTYTKIPVPKVLAWSSNSSNPVGAEYIIMEKASGVQLVKKMDEMSDMQQSNLVKVLTTLEGELTAIKLPAHGSLYLR